MALELFCVLPEVASNTFLFCILLTFTELRSALNCCDNAAILGAPFFAPALGLAPGRLLCVFCFCASCGFGGTGSSLGGSNMTFATIFSFTSSSPDISGNNCITNKKSMMGITTFLISFSNASCCSFSSCHGNSRSKAK